MGRSWKLDTQVLFLKTIRFYRFASRTINSSVARTQSSPKKIYIFVYIWIHITFLWIINIVAVYLSTLLSCQVKVKKIMEIVTIWWGEQNVTWLKKNEWVLCYINVILQLSQLSTKQVAVVQRVPDEDSNIINHAADDLVGLSFCLRIYLLCFLHTHTHTYVYIVYILCLRVALTTFFSFIHKIFFV